MRCRRLISTCLTLAVVLGAAGAITQGAKLATPAPESVLTVRQAKGPAYNGKTLARAAGTLQGSAWLVGRAGPEPVRREPAPDSKPPTGDRQPEPQPAPEQGAMPAPEPPPSVRQERPENSPAPAPRAKEQPTSGKPVIVRNESLWPGRPLG